MTLCSPCKDCNHGKYRSSCGGPSSGICTPCPPAGSPACLVSNSLEYFTTTSDQSSNSASKYCGEFGNPVESPYEIEYTVHSLGSKYNTDQLNAPIVEQNWQIMFRMSVGITLFLSQLTFGKIEYPLPRYLVPWLSGQTVTCRSLSRFSQPVTNFYMWKFVTGLSRTGKCK